MREVIHYQSRDHYTADDYPNGFMEICSMTGARSALGTGPGYLYLGMDTACTVWSSAGRRIHDKVIEGPVE